MSVNELEQAKLVHSEWRMAITSFACDILSPVRSREEDYKTDEKT
jgi:hypothetical protein